MQIVNKLKRKDSLLTTSFPITKKLEKIQIRHSKIISQINIGNNMAKINNMERKTTNNKPEPHKNSGLSLGLRKDKLFLIHLNHSLCCRSK